MPFENPEDQTEFNNLVALITQGKSTEVEYYQEGRDATGNRLPLPAEWGDLNRIGFGTRVQRIMRTITDPNNVSGTISVLFKWKNPNGLTNRNMLTPAFEKQWFWGLVHIGFTLRIHPYVNSAELEQLFTAIAQNDVFASQIIEIDFTNCSRLTRPVVFPRNLINVRNLFMERMSTSTTYVSNDPYDIWDGSQVYSRAECGAPDVSALRSLRVLSFDLTYFDSWPQLPRSLEEYTHYGRADINRVNLSSRALPNLKRVFFSGGVSNNLTEAYAICLSIMLRARPELRFSLDNKRYKLTDKQYDWGEFDARNKQLTLDLLEEHFQAVVHESSYADATLVTAEDLSQCADALDGMLADALDIRSRAVLTYYVMFRLPAVIEQVTAEHARREELARQIPMPSLEVASAPSSPMTPRPQILR